MLLVAKDQEHFCLCYQGRISMLIKITIVIASVIVIKRGIIFFGG
jgi:hypothetical protein